MKTYTTSEIAAFDFTVTYAAAAFSGYGHNKIEVEVEYNGERKSFKATTTSLDSVEDAKELEGQEKYEALFEIVEYSLGGVIAEWIIELEDKED